MDYRRLTEHPIGSEGFLVAHPSCGWKPGKMRAEITDAKILRG